MKTALLIPAALAVLALPCSAVVVAAPVGAGSCDLANPISSCVCRAALAGTSEQACIGGAPTANLSRLQPGDG